MFGCSSFCNETYSLFQSKKIEVLYDDRKERPGIKFADHDLIGIPLQIIVGKSFLSDNKITLKRRKDGKEQILDSKQIFSTIMSIIND